MTKTNKEESIEKKIDVFSENLTKGRFGGAARYRLMMDSPQAGVESKYFSILRILTDDEPYGRGIKENAGHVVKTKDIYSAGETSSYWGSVEQKRGAQIDKFQQIMQNVGSMVKTMFQLLRELRIMEERIKFYEDSDKGDKNAEVHLKSVWSDVVEGGAQSPTSVMGLTSQVGFAALADLFFSIHPKTDKDVEKEVKKLKETYGINKKVREVLGRKLKQYLVWREKTYKELSVGQKFKLGYLRQHYSVIRLYLSWLRPYLRNIQRLQMKTEGVATDKDLVAAFETSKLELEFLAIRDEYFKGTERGKIKTKFKDFFPVVRVRINFVVIPQMAYQDEGQRGAMHMGQSEILIDGAVLSKKELENYQKNLNEDDMDLLTVIDSSIEALREELSYYLEKAGGAFDIHKEPEEKKEKPKGGIFEPFIALGDFFKEIAGVEFKKKQKGSSSSEKDAAEFLAKLDSYLAYYIFKKQNGMITE
tara:strand:- start:902 stop:2329 length:1428 start_codon:yes stop_codon:yes gene_type:complete